MGWGGVEREGWGEAGWSGVGGLGWGGWLAAWSRVLSDGTSMLFLSARFCVSCKHACICFFVCVCIALFFEPRVTFDLSLQQTPIFENIDEPQSLKTFCVSYFLFT